MGETIEQRGCHFRIAEHAGPLAEAEVGRDDDAGTLVEFAQQVEQERAARCAERQVAKLIEDHEVGVDQTVRDLTGSSLGLFLFERVDQFDS